MSGGEPSVAREGHQSSRPDLHVRELDNPKLLRAVAKKYNIESTKSLVAAYNATTDKDERGVLLRWLRQYIRQKDELSRPENLLEFAELAKVIPLTTKDEDLLRGTVYLFRTYLQHGEFLEKDAQQKPCFLCSPGSIRPYMTTPRN